MLIRNSLIAAAALAVSFVAFQPAAQAGTKVGIYLGAGHNSHGYHPGRHYRPHRAHRRYRRNSYYYGGYNTYRPYPPYVSQAAYYQWPAHKVRRSLRHRGYHNISKLRYRKGYWVVKANKHGRRFKLRVSGYSGAIVRRHRLH